MQQTKDSNCQNLTLFKVSLISPGGEVVVEIKSTVNL